MWSGKTCVLPAKPGFSKLAIGSTPPLTLSVDGKSVGTGAVILDLAPGKHVVVGRGGGATLKRVVTLQSGQTQNVDLVVRSGRLAVEARTGYEVYVDGGFVGRTPFSPIELVEGSHFVLVKHGALEYRHAVTIQPDEELYLQVQLHIPD